MISPTQTSQNPNNSTNDAPSATNKATLHSLEARINIISEAIKLLEADKNALHSRVGKLTKQVKQLTDHRRRALADLHGVQGVQGGEKAGTKVNKVDIFMRKAKENGIIVEDAPDTEGK